MNHQTSETPRVTVIVPAYGVAHLVGEALESLLAQTERNWECVVVDDGAPDDVAGAIARFLADPRITFLETDNGGVGCARNRAIAATTAPLITLLDGDDMLRPRYLEAMAAALEADEQARLVTCNARIFGEVERERHCFTKRQGHGDGRTGTLADVLDRSFGVYIGSTFRRADFESVGGFDTTMTHAEDFDFWVRLMLLGGHALYVDEVLGDYRVRGSSASAATVKMHEGTLTTYRKVAAKLPADAPEREVALAMAAEDERAIAFETSMDRVIEGELGALPDLRRARGREQGRVWDAAFLLWRLVPGLAPRMLEKRRRANARGAGAASASGAEQGKPA